MGLTYKFFLTDTDTGQQVEAREPSNWDKTRVSLKRDLNNFGVTYEFTAKQLEFSDNNSIRLLKNAYDTRGCDAVVNLLIEQVCNDGESPSTFFPGKIDFNDYIYSNDPYCSVNVGIEPDGCDMQFVNNIDQKVDLETLKGFDGQTVLERYDKLPFVASIPGKAIKLTDQAKATIDISTSIDEDSDYNIPFDISDEDPHGYIMIPFDLNDLVEFGTFATLPDADYVAGNIGALNDDNSFFKNTNAEAIPCGGAINLQLKGTFQWIINTSASYSLNVPDLVLLKKAPGAGSGVPLIDLSATTDVISGGGLIRTLTYVVDQNVTFTLADNDDLYLYVRVDVHKTTTGNVFMDFKVSKDSYLKMFQTSLCAPTDSKLFMINEAMSRTVEAITNNCMCVYSGFFGRTDAQPYASKTDGCGSLESLTMGLFLRRINVIKDTNAQPVFSLSFKDIMDGVKAIHCVGYGIESDPNRPGKRLIRVEPAKYFFSDNVILDLGEVRLKKQATPTYQFHIFKFGYDKWAAEDYNGLDEFLTKREYRNNIVNGQTVYEQICKLIASGYAIEITRRKGNDNSKDWRYDSESFILCMRRDGGNIIVEQGNLTAAENILDPGTILNGRISPIRNALNWVNYIFQGYRKIDSNAKLIFTSGESNYAAKFAITNACKLEVGALSEKGDIDSTVFADATTPIPIFRAETDVISSAPLSLKDFNKISDNPYDLITYLDKGTRGYGWVSIVDYNMAEGDANFTLLPKFN